MQTYKQLHEVTKEKVKLLWRSLTLHAKKDESKDSHLRKIIFI